MSTRALYTFIDQNNVYHVYKHHDGYPSGAYEWISGALMFAWNLPRFEAAEFSAAFVAANKTGSGGVYLSTGNHRDLSYRYEISESSFYENMLHIKAFSMPENKIIFEGTLNDFKSFENTGE